MSMEPVTAGLRKSEKTDLGFFYRNVERKVLQRMLVNEPDLQRDHSKPIALVDEPVLLDCFNFLPFPKSR
jgi:hypothetical protein